eukprot:CAMPEP_0114474204 /NCGR_PEP_ID=MMETSP0104-20121206/13439_1 /TAXON_ID=37642 ORGANISM="Paraphysomonas imperforata, Strain PA2" /NCGR_SAMPLE_ID=MMETSP0104 /ASSEMBLY_ACC=CAM_ASM_000202 /LENGTH=167 /DNA_ID=CAMNT_0001648537 /DNA_START=40 /DNA_END=540 /DNA_ORIENTATION=-
MTPPSLWRKQHDQQLRAEKALRKQHSQQRVRDLLTVSVANIPPGSCSLGSQRSITEFEELLRARFYSQQVLPGASQGGLMCQTLHNQMPYTRTLLSDDEAGNREGLRYYSEDIFANSAEQEEGQGVQELVSSLISDLSVLDSRHNDDFQIKPDSSKGCVGESVAEDY